MPSSLDRRTLSLLEVPRAAIEASNTLALTPGLAMTPIGDGHGVFVLPGFAASDRSTSALRLFLQSRGYRTSGWDLGRNLGIRRSGGMEALEEAFNNFADAAPGRVSLVGWSLGGVYARRLARVAKDRVRQVISLGSPIAGDLTDTAVWRVYEEVNGQHIARDVVRNFQAENALVPPVPSTAIYSRTDPIVPWHMAREVETETTDNIEVPGSHIGLGFNALVYYLVARKLAHPEDAWKKFPQDDLVYQAACQLSGVTPVREAG